MNTDKTIEQPVDSDLTEQRSPESLEADRRHVLELLARLRQQETCPSNDLASLELLGC